MLGGLPFSGGGVSVIGVALLPCSLLLMVRASFTSLSVASVASRALTMRVLSFLSGVNAVCRTLTVFEKAVLVAVTLPMLFWALVRSIVRLGICRIALLGL